MGRFNLIEEDWITVASKHSGEQKLVSLGELFENAHQYQRLAGDSRTQDFAVFRIILAITTTVFSRVDAKGKVYDELELNENSLKLKTFAESTIESFEDALLDAWEEVWENKKFPKSIQDYLEKWHDRFYLFDENFPFMQVTKHDFESIGLIRRGKLVDKGTEVSGKTINRTISESGNKISLFSPKTDKKDNKNILSEAELARWLITFQAYTGTFDKTVFDVDKYTSSKGWLFDIGGIYVEGNDLFETIMLNTVLIHEFGGTQFHLNQQRPCWEITPLEKIKEYLRGNNVNNIAELFTLWSRAICIDPETDLTEPLTFEIVKLPELEHENQFLEPMTLYRFNKSGPSKNKYTPRKHPANQAFWRSFGLFAKPSLEEANHIKPGIMDWYSSLKEWNLIPDKSVTIHSVSMKDDGNATSWVPVDEICDYLNFNDFILEEFVENGWTYRIDEAVEMTKKSIGFTYKIFIDDILEIRNVKNPNARDQKIEELYFLVDLPFKEWLASIQVDDPKEEKVREWYTELRAIIKSQADRLMIHANNRDFTGIVKGEKEDFKNIVTAYNSFLYFLNKDLSVKKGR